MRSVLVLALVMAVCCPQALASDYESLDNNYVNLTLFQSASGCSSGVHSSTQYLNVAGCTSLGLGESPIPISTNVTCLAGGIPYGYLCNYDSCTEVAPPVTLIPQPSPELVSYGNISFRGYGSEGCSRLILSHDFIANYSRCQVLNTAGTDTFWKADCLSNGYYKLAVCTDITCAECTDLPSNSSDSCSALTGTGIIQSISATCPTYPPPAICKLIDGSLTRGMGWGVPYCTSTDLGGETISSSFTCIGSDGPSSPLSPSASPSSAPSNQTTNPSTSPSEPAPAPSSASLLSNSFTAALATAAAVSLSML